MINQKTVENLEIIDKCKAGDQKAFRMLFESFKNSLFLLCLRYSSCKEEAEDYLQESFIKIYKEINQYQVERGSFYTWASRISINTCLEHLRKKKMIIEDINEIIKRKEFEESYNIISELSLADMIKEIHKMPPGYRTVFNLYCIEGYNHKEISDLLGITENTSKTQLMRSKVYLREKLLNQVELG